MIGKKVLKIKFVCTGDNDADLYTKNVVRELYDRHFKKVIVSAKEIE